MKRYLKQIKSLKKINKSNITSNKFLVNKEGNIKIYYAPFDYINSKAKIMIVGITPGLQQMLQSFEVINEGKSLKEVKDLSSFKGSMRTTLVKYLDELMVNKTLKIKSELKIICFPVLTWPGNFFSIKPDIMAASLKFFFKSGVSSSHSNKSSNIKSSLNNRSISYIQFIDHIAKA